MAFIVVRSFTRLMRSGVTRSTTDFTISTFLPRLHRRSPLVHQFHTTPRYRGILDPPPQEFDSLQGREWRDSPWTVTLIREPHEDENEFEKELVKKRIEGLFREWNKEKLGRDEPLLDCYDIRATSEAKDVDDSPQAVRPSLFKDLAGLYVKEAEYHELLARTADLPGVSAVYRESGVYDGLLPSTDPLAESLESTAPCNVTAPLDNPASQSE